ncbi:hypothetical protein VMCG_01365 [Cytospora schulzeri]|uniref:Uncharacterized protein n=1 Tax=Cytospora schulzeri TaxID=448051 RepID=A0A423X688_9PEZI|nr:hypothetical protein VMCG_01365 [Valsa malicola]
MCVIIYRRCICGHREKHGSTKRCDKAKKAARSFCFVPFIGPKLDGKGYCVNSKSDSFGVPEPCRECKAEGGVVNRLSGPNPVQRPGANPSGQTYYYDGGLTTRSGGGQGLVPLPPSRAHLTPSSCHERYRQIPLSKYNTQTQQPQVYQEQPRPPSRYENPRLPPPPPPPPRGTNYAPEPDSKARKHSVKYAKKTLHEAEKVRKDTKKKANRVTVEDIRARAIAKAREEKRRPEPVSLRHGGGSSMNSDYPAPLTSRNYRPPATPADLHDAVYPDLRHHPALKSEVEFAAQHEAFNKGTHYDEDTRRFQDNTVRWGAASHPNACRRDRPNRDPKQYTTRAEADRYQQQSYAAPYGGYGVGGNRVSPLTYGPHESQISALNVTHKLPYNYQRR